MAFHGLVKDSITLAVARKVARGPRRRRGVALSSTLPKRLEGLTVREAFRLGAAQRPAPKRPKFREQVAQAFREGARGA